MNFLTPARSRRCGALLLLASDGQESQEQELIPVGNGNEERHIPEPPETESACAHKGKCSEGARPLSRRAYQWPSFRDSAYSNGGIHRIVKTWQPVKLQQENGGRHRA